jgi:hypothetical protein
MGFVLGALVGGAAGVGLGLAWTDLFETGCFEAYCAMLVYFGFMPIGAILGGVAGAIWLAMAAARRRKTPAPT